MKQSEIRNCFVCDKGIAHDNQMVFFKISLDYMILNLRNIQRQSGLEQMIGNPQIAAVMGPDLDMAASINRVDALICLHCSMSQTSIWQLFEKAGEDTHEKES